MFIISIWEFPGGGLILPSVVAADFLTVDEFLVCRVCVWMWTHLWKAWIETVFSKTHRELTSTQGPRSGTGHKAIFGVYFSAWTFPRHMGSYRGMHPGHRSRLQTHR